MTDNNKSCRFSMRNKTFYLATSFAAVPGISVLVMTGVFFRFAVVLTVAILGFIAVGVVMCIRDRAYVRGVVTTSVICILALLSSLWTYKYTVCYATEIVKQNRGEKHTYAGYVTREDSPNKNTMYVEIYYADGQKLTEPLLCRGYNYTGNYFFEGTYVELDGVIDTVKNDKKHESYTEWLRSKGVFCTLSNIENLKTAVDKDKAPLGKSIRDGVYRRLLSVLSAIPGEGKFDRATALGKALMFGDKSGLDSEMKDAFSKSGTTHILCVSGLHFSVMLAGMSVLLSFLVKDIRIRRCILFILCIVYLLMCGFAKSAVRAAIMALVTALGVVGRENRGCTHSVLAASAAICIIDPFAVFDTGFRMSVLACIGIACSSYFSDAASRRLSGHPVCSYLASTCMMSVSAFAFLFPYFVFSTGNISTVSVIASMAVVYPAQILLIVCWITAFLSCLQIEFLNYVLACVISAISEYICNAASFFGNLKYAHFNVEAPKFAIAVFLVTTILAAFAVGSRYRGAFIYVFVLSASVTATSVLLIMS